MLDRIYLEISNICNIQCSFCPIVERDKKTLNPLNFEKILKMAAPLAKQICLHLMGEPLAHPQFLQILAICETYQAPIQITTNGLLLKKYQNELLKHHSIRQINFSLQSFKDNFPHKNLLDYLTPILDFCRMANEQKPQAYINLRLWNVTNGQENNDEIYQLIESYFEIKINRSIDVGNIKSKKIWNNVYLHFDSRFEWPSLNLPFQSEKGTCKALSGHIGIHADGTVVPCCLDKEAQIPLGNCLDTDLSEILNGERAQNMKKGFESGILVEDLCKHCTYIKRFSKKK